MINKTHFVMKKFDEIIMVIVCVFELRNPFKDHRRSSDKST